MHWYRYLRADVQEGGPYGRGSGEAVADSPDRVVEGVGGAAGV
jgi:hypothetical protein